MNTWFQHHQRHLYTWKSLGDGVRNKIDYITMNKRFRNAITQVKWYPGADCGSDHVPIGRYYESEVEDSQKMKKEDVKLQLDLLTSDNECSREYSQKVSEHMTGINAIDDIEARYQHFRGDTDGVCPATIARSREKQPDRNGWLHRYYRRWSRGDSLKGM